MRKIALFLIAASLAALASCQKDPVPSAAENAAPAVLHATFESPATTRAGFDYDAAGKTYSHFWETGDKIAFFPKEDRPDLYTCTDPEAGTFALTQHSLLETKRADYSHNYAIYPYDSPIGIDFLHYNYDEEIVELMEMEFGMGYPISTGNPPCLQIQVLGSETYTEGDNTYGYGNVLVARSTNEQLKFQSVMGWLKIQLTGAAPLQKVRIQADETSGPIALQGAGRIRFATDGTPSLEMETDCDAAKPWKEYKFGSNTVILDPVTPTSVYLALPPTEFTNGFTVTVTYADNTTSVFSTTRPISIQRNHVTPMASREGKDLRATLVTGTTFSRDIKTLAHGSSFSYSASDNLIKQVVVRKGSNVTSDCVVSVGTSDHPVYAVFDSQTGIMTLHTPAYHIVLPTIISSMFRGFRAMTHVDWDQFDASNVTNAEDLFTNCASLTESPGVVLPKATNVSYLFSGCTGLLSFGDVSFPAATNASNLFNGCTSLSSVGNVDMPNATNVSSLFKGCTVLSSLGTLTFPNVTNISHLFDGCQTLGSYGDVSFGSATSASYLFNGCTSLATVGDISLPNVTDASYLLAGCTALTEVGAINLPSTTQVSYLLSGCNHLPSVNLVTGNAVVNMSYLFNNCSALTSVGDFVPVSSVVTNLEYMFYGCSNLPTVDVSGLSGPLTGMAGMFYNCTKFTSVEFNAGLNTAAVTDMSGLFYGCSGLNSLDVTGFNTANVTSMRAMFQGCSGLSSLDLSGFNTNKVVDTGLMFSGCTALTTLGSGTSFTCTAIERCDRMFENCSNLGNVNISQMRGALKGANSYSSPQLTRMFYNCSKMTTIQFHSNLTTDAVYDYSEIFRGCSSLTQLYIKGFYLKERSSDNPAVRFANTMTGVPSSCTVHYTAAPSIGTHAGCYDVPSMFAFYSSPKNFNFTTN